MRDYVYLGSAPYDEDCVQANNMEAMTEECMRYKQLLEQLYPVPQGINARYTIRTFTHDFGSYKAVCIVYDDADLVAFEFAYLVEGNIPARWEE